MPFEGFREQDFTIFLEPDEAIRVDYIRDSLHPRLRGLGAELAESLSGLVDMRLRSQLRSGRWHKNPWATWVSLVSVEEKVRGDPKRPRLTVFLDYQEVMVGSCQSIWQPDWARLADEFPPLVELIDDTARDGGLDIAIAHWVQDEAGASRWAGETWRRETKHYATGKQALKDATRLGQDFFLLGRTYAWPKRKFLLVSPDFSKEALAVLEASWPLYHLAFLQREG